MNYTNQILDLYQEPYLLHWQLEELTKGKDLIQYGENGKAREDYSVPFEVKEYVYLSSSDDSQKVVFKVEEGKISEVFLSN